MTFSFSEIKRRFLPLLYRAAVLDVIPGLNNRLTQTQPCDDPAQRTSPACTGNGLNDTINMIYNKFANVFFLALAGIAVIMLMYAGVQYIMAAGNADRVKRARQNIINVIAGILILITAYGIIRLIVLLANTLATRS